MSLRLVHVVDTSSGRETTVKVKRMAYGDGFVDLMIHQIEGVYESEEAFDREWDEKPDKAGLVNFLSLDLVDARKLVNAMLEEIRG